MYRLFEELFSEEEHATSEVRFEPLLRKLTMHNRMRIKRTAEYRYLDQDSVETTMWFMCTMRIILEKYYGASVMDLISGNDNTYNPKNIYVFEEYQV